METKKNKIKNRCNHVWNWNIIDAVDEREKPILILACQNGDSKVNEEILYLFSYLF